MLSQNLRAVDQNKDIIPAGRERNLTCLFFFTDFSSWFLQAILRVAPVQCANRVVDTVVLEECVTVTNIHIEIALFTKP